MWVFFQSFLFSIQLECVLVNKKKLSRSWAKKNLGFLKNLGLYWYIIIKVLGRFIISLHTIVFVSLRACENWTTIMAESCESACACALCAHHKRLNQHRRRCFGLSNNIRSVCICVRQNYCSKNSNTSTTPTPALRAHSTIGLDGGDDYDDDVDKQLMHWKIWLLYQRTHSAVSIQNKCTPLLLLLLYCHC